MTETIYRLVSCLFVVLGVYALGGILLWVFGAPKRRSFPCILGITAIAVALGWRMILQPVSKRYMLSLIVPAILLAAYFCAGLPRLAGRKMIRLRKYSAVLSVLLLLPLAAALFAKDMRFNPHGNWLKVICDAYVEHSRDAADRKLHLSEKEKRRCGHYLPEARDGELPEMPRSFQSVIADYRKMGKAWRDFLAALRHCPYPCYLMMNEEPTCPPLSEVNDVPGLAIRLRLETFTSRKRDKLIRLYEVTSREAEMHVLDGVRQPPVSETALIPNGGFESWQPDAYAEAIQERMSKQLSSVSVDAVPKNWGLRILDAAARFSRPAVLSRETKQAISGEASCRMSADALIALVGTSRIQPGNYRLTFRVRALRDSRFGVRLSYAVPTPERVYLADFRLAQGKCLQISMPIYRNDFLQSQTAYPTFDLMFGEILLDDVVVTPANGEPEPAERRKTPPSSGGGAPTPTNQGFVTC